MDIEVYNVYVEVGLQHGSGISSSVIIARKQCFLLLEVLDLPQG